MFNGLVGLMATVVTEPSKFDPVAYNASVPHFERPLFALPEPATIALALIGVSLLVLFVRAKRFARITEADFAAAARGSSNAGRRTRRGKKTAA